MKSSILVLGCLLCSRAVGSSLKVSMVSKERSEAYLSLLAEHQRLMSSGEGDLQANLSSVDDLLSTARVAFGNQEFNLVLDTGSTNTWVTGTNCSSAVCKSHPLYDPSKSETFQDTPDNEVVQIHFGTGRIEGVMKKESVSVGGLDGLKVTHQNFLLTTNERGSVFNKESFSGVLGLGFKSLAYKQHTPVFDSICEAGLLNEHQFYFLLSNPKAQYFVMGRPSDFDSHYVGTLDSFPVIDPYYWTVELEDIRFNNESLLQGEVLEKSCQLKKGSEGSGSRDRYLCRATFDSGSALNTLPTPVYKELIQAHNEVHCSHGALAKGAQLTYVFGGKEFTFDADEYISQAVSDPSACSTVLLQNLDVSNEHGPLFILGRVFFEKYLAVFRKGKSDDAGSEMLLGVLNKDYEASHSSSIRAMLLQSLSHILPW